MQSYKIKLKVQSCCSVNIQDQSYARTLHTSPGCTLNKVVNLTQRIQVVYCVLKDVGQSKGMSSDPRILKGQLFHQTGHLRCG